MQIPASVFVWIVHHFREVGVGMRVLRVPAPACNSRWDIRKDWKMVIKHESVKLKAAKAGIEFGQSGLIKQVLFGLAAQMRVGEKDCLVEVHEKNNPWGMEEGWYEVGELLGWISKYMIER